MRTILKLISFGVLLCLNLLPAYADQITVGTYDTGRCYPFMCNNSGTDVGQILDYQQVYAASAFGGVSTVNSLTWYYDTVDGGNATLLGGTYTLYWGYASLDSVGHLSNHLANNYISGPNTIGSFTIAPGGVNDDPSFTFSLNGAQRFNYDPALGNLLLEVVVTNQDNVPNGSGNGYNQVDDTGAFTSRAYCEYNGCHADSSGLVTTFDVSSPVPEPGSLALLGTGVIGLAGFVRRKLGR
jgi:hypothetical protein